MEKIVHTFLGILAVVLTFAGLVGIPVALIGWVWGDFDFWFRVLLTFAVLFFSGGVLSRCVDEKKMFNI